MPITKQASKKLRHDRKITVRTMTVRTSVRDVVKMMRKSPTAKTLTKAFQVLDKAAKRNIVHKNKAARLKASLAKLIAKK